MVLWRLFSILRSYIKRRSRTLSFEKSFIAIWPRGRSGLGSALSFFGGCRCLGKNDFARLANGLGSSGLLRASIVWFWMVSVRLGAMREIQCVLLT